MENNILTCEHVRKCFPIAGGEFVALKDINMTVPREKLTILKGRSGSGKTTLLNILSTLDAPTSGEVYFDDRRYSGFKESDRELIRKKEIGFIFQSVALIPIMNAYENIDFSLRLGGYKGNHDERIRYLASILGMEERLSHMPGQMSGGEQQRIAIARAIAMRPKLIFADEPTGALDTEAGIRVMQLFKQLIEKEHVTIVMTTHDPNLMDLGDVVYEMEDGDLVERRENY